MLFWMFVFGVVVGIVFTVAIAYFAINAIHIVANEEIKYDESPNIRIVNSVQQR